MAESKARAAKAAAKTPAPEPTPVQPRLLPPAARPTPLIAGVNAPAGPSSLTAPAGVQQVRQPEPFLSEGMRNDLQDLGYAIDPVSHARFDRNQHTGKVTMRRRIPGEVPAVAVQGYGKPTPVEVAFAPQPAVNDTDQAADVTANPLVSDQPAAPAEHTDRPNELPTGETLTHDPATGVTLAHNPVTGESRVVDEDELKAAQGNPGED